MEKKIRNNFFASALPKIFKRPFNPHCFCNLIMQLRPSFTIFFLLLYLVSPAGQGTRVSEYSSLYAGSIFKADLQNEVYNKSIDDLREYLQKSTSSVFTVSNFSGSTKPEGIYLVLNSPSLPLSPTDAKKLKAGGIEDFIIIGTVDKLLIVASHPTGLSRGIYSYLDQLGYKWYFPGDTWTHIPVLKNIEIRQKKYVTPSFALRDFFGTGGLFPVPSITEDDIIKKNWEDWKRRNRMGGSVRLGGHYWETFNLRYKKELLEHPEFLAEIKGKRVEWHVSSKFCISNMALQELFVEDRVKAMREELNKSVYSAEKIIIGVDPSDGGGHCECGNCKKMGSVSDRVFFLANRVAKKFAAESSRAFVNLYAYNEHAAPPAISLEPNVIVQIIPYAFQNVGTPQQMITLWKKKSRNLYLYDYYGIPDWHYEVPLTGRWSVYELSKKLKYWKQNDVKGVLFESSNGIGTTGLGLYLVSRLGWNSNEDIGKTIAAFYRNMFGKGDGWVKQYYDKISFDFKEIADIPYLYNALDQVVSSTPRDQQVAERVNLLRAYIHYAALYYQYKSSKDKINDGSWERLIQYAWEIYPSMMIHTTRIAELLRLEVLSNQLLTDKWGIYNATAVGIKNTKWISDNTINEYVSADKRRFPLLEDFDYVRPPVSYEFIPKKNITLKDSTKEILVMDFPDLFIKMSAGGYFKFSMKTNEGSTVPQQNVTISIIDTAKGDVIWEQTRKITQRWSEVVIKQKPGKTYQLYIKKEGWMKLAIRNTEYFFIRKVPIYSYLGKLWFYIPGNKSYFYFKNAGDIHPDFYNPSGDKVQPVKVNEAGVYKLTSSKAGGWWSVEKTELKSLEFYNYPLVFLPHPNYTVKQVMWK